MHNIVRLNIIKGSTAFAGKSPLFVVWIKWSFYQTTEIKILYLLGLFFLLFLKQPCRPTSCWQQHKAGLDWAWTWGVTSQHTTHPLFQGFDFGSSLGKIHSATTQAQGRWHSYLDLSLAHLWFSKSIDIWSLLYKNVDFWQWTTLAVYLYSLYQFPLREKGFTPKQGHKVWQTPVLPMFKCKGFREAAVLPTAICLSNHPD